MTDDQLALSIPHQTAPPAPAPQPARKEPEPATPAQALTAWLCDLVRRHQYGTLGDLRRPHRLSEARLLAANYAPTEADRSAYAFTAFLFARYHQGASRPSHGFGDLGTAMRRIGTDAARGPADDGCKRLFNRLVNASALPEAALQNAVERLRTGGNVAPSWATLALDLTRWNTPDRRVQETWARNYFTPPRRPTP
ncbi:type I-E CRISPR-associated protein Cse2/CasB [Embleya sp. NPDC050493]|uniref:type I-E CRISPR-associated protein Cse2/CasB n=1 Tax=Embleya sp. NPDC050493 TaxID=3363989 RepID=UPI003792740B